MGHQRKSPFEKVTESLGSETVPSAAQWNELLGRCRFFYPGTPRPTIYKWMFGETTISYIKIGIIQLKQPFINGWPWGSRINLGRVVFSNRGKRQGESRGKEIWIPPFAHLLFPERFIKPFRTPLKDGCL